MAWPEAPGLAARAALRERKRARVKRARRLAALVVVRRRRARPSPPHGSTARAAQRPVETAGLAPAQRLLPSGPPRPQVVAVHETLRIQLPDQPGPGDRDRLPRGRRRRALELEPSARRRTPASSAGSSSTSSGSDGSGIRYYLLEGGDRRRSTGGLDVGRPGRDRRLRAGGRHRASRSPTASSTAAPTGKRIEIQPAGNPGVVVVLTNLQADPALSVGSTRRRGADEARAAARPLERVERAGLARYTQDAGQHVHLEVHAAASLVRRPSASAAILFLARRLRRARPPRRRGAPAAACARSSRSTSAS